METIETHVLTLHDDSRSVLAAFEVCDAVPVGGKATMVSAEYSNQIPGSYYSVWKVTWYLPVTVTEEKQ